MSPSYKNCEKLCSNFQTGNLDKYSINFGCFDDISLEILDIGNNIKVDICTLYTNIFTSGSGVAFLWH